LTVVLFVKQLEICVWPMKVRFTLNEVRVITEETVGILYSVL